MKQIMDKEHTTFPFIKPGLMDPNWDAYALDASPYADPQIINNL